MATHDSPRGRAVETVSGNAADISARGQQIIDLGEMLTTSAEIIARIAGDDSETAGKAVKKLRESCGEVNADLGLAGELYTAVGPHVRNYGDALARIQANMSRIVPEANQRWSAYQAASGHYNFLQLSPPTYFTPPTGDPAADDAARAQRERDHEQDVQHARHERDAAYGLWEDSASDFDREYDSWWHEFDTAARGVSAGWVDELGDTFWDELDTFVAAALDVLQVIGVVVAVLALLVGGPIVALIGAIVAVATLALTIYSFARGNSSGWDLAFAIVGVIPIGSLSAIADGGVGAAYKAWAGFGSGGLSFTDDAARWGGATWDMINGGGARGFLSTMRNATNAGFVEDFVGFTSGSSSRVWDDVAEGVQSTGEGLLVAADAVLSHYSNQYLLPYDIYQLVTGN